MPSTSLPHQSRRAFRSWKEIASYLGATVRSVQRWEDAGLPVHRLGVGRKARVFAWQDELDAWMAEGGLKRATAEIPPAPRQDRWRVPVVVAAALAALAGLFFGLASRGGGPASWTIEDSRLRILDDRGRLCWEKVLPRSHDTYRGEIVDKALIDDLDGDGRREVLLNTLPENLAADGGRLVCYEHDGRERWQVRLGAPKTFGDRTFQHSYRGRLLRVVRFNGRSYVLSIANHYIWYPSQTTLRDPATGRIVEQYWHPGAVHYCALHDLDGDGVDEVLLGALNNPGDGVGHAALAVLTLPFSRAPRRAPDPRFSAVTGGGEAGYVLFPVPDILRTASLLPLLSDLHVDSAGRIVVQTQLQENSGVVYSLDRRLNVIDCRQSDNFAPIHDRLFRQGLLDHPLTPRELSALCRVAEFNAAPNGNSPTLAALWPN